MTAPRLSTSEVSMFTVTCLTAPSQRILDANRLDWLRDAWGGGDLYWLALDEAAEFEIETEPDDLWTRWAEMQAQGVDLAVQRSEGRRKHLLIADMDSTMIEQECIDELADEAGIGALVAAITERAMNGELDFEAALTERVRLLKGMDIGVIRKVMESRITTTPGSRKLVATMKAHGAYTALVSGGFSEFTRLVAGWLGFDENRANDLLHVGGKLTGEVARPILGRDAKAAALDEISAMMGLDLSQCMAVGDGANDLGMLEKAGAGVAFHAKPLVVDRCRLRINHGDLTALLYLQGYYRDEIVTV
jgi:phosphoserine phosphatase